MSPKRLWPAALVLLAATASLAAQEPAEIKEFNKLFVKVIGPGELYFRGVAFAPGGGEVFAWGSGYARWKTEGTLLAGRAGAMGVSGAGYTKDGKRLLAYVSDSSDMKDFAGVMTWDTAKGKTTRVPLGPFKVGVVPGKVSAIPPPPKPGKPPAPPPGSGVYWQPEAAAFTPDGKYVLLAPMETVDKEVDKALFLKACSLYLAEAQRPAPPRAFPQKHTDRISCLALSADGKRAATGSGDKTVRLWEVPSGKELKVFKDARSAPRSVAVSVDGGRVAAAADTDDPVVRVWDAKTGAALASYRGHKTGAQAVAFTPDGRRALSADGSEVHLWEVDTGKLVGRMTANAQAVAVSPDGRLAATTGAPTLGTVRLWELP